MLKRLWKWFCLALARPLPLSDAEAATSRPRVNDEGADAYPVSDVAYGEHGAEIIATCLTPVGLLVLSLHVDGAARADGEETPDVSGPRGVLRHAAAVLAQALRPCPDPECGRVGHHAVECGLVGPSLDMAAGEMISATPSSTRYPDPTEE